MKKTKEQLETEIMVGEKLKEQEEVHDKKYAIKLVERIVFTLLSTAFLYLAGWFIYQLIQKP